MNRADYISRNRTEHRWNSSARQAVRVKENLAGVAALQHGEGAFEFFERFALAEDGLEVQAAGFEERGHLDPGLIHAAAVDAVDCGAFEDDVVDQIERDRSRGNAEKRGAAAGAQGFEALLNGCGVARHFEKDVHTDSTG